MPQFFAVNMLKGSQREASMADWNAPSSIGTQNICTFMDLHTVEFSLPCCWYPIAMLILPGGFWFDSEIDDLSHPQMVTPKCHEHRHASWNSAGVPSVHRQAYGRWTSTACLSQDGLSLNCTGAKGIQGMLRTRISNDSRWQEHFTSPSRLSSMHSWSETWYHSQCYDVSMIICWEADAATFQAFLFNVSNVFM